MAEEPGLLVDLSNAPLEEFQKLMDEDELIEKSMTEVIKQVVRRRVNLGNTGPPGRMD